jgi:hypothetical protein
LEPRADPRVDSPALRVLSLAHAPCTMRIAQGAVKRRAPRSVRCDHVTTLVRYACEHRKKTRRGIEAPAWWPGRAAAAKRDLGLSADVSATRDRGVDRGGA